MGKLILLRHGQSQWNLENRFTGWIDIGLTDQGRQEAYECGKLLKDIPIDLAFTSVLVRAIDTLTEALRGADQELVPIVKDAALNERMYGDLQGKNKAELAKEFGDEQVKIWRRSYEVAPPNGESLKDTAERALPYFDKNILPLVVEGKTILVSAHGNSLRAIVMKLDNLTKDQVLELNIPNAEPIMYTINPLGEVIEKEFL
ncbi:MAG TPA: 2,3-diphosphoglycerate-dependent phosphoglycerate mutase [Candidatus Kapabacteria bacterium]|nr:2,3-diphosphoglycerate-dependent phosphoglycerate mutase [Candidatus Kapabacteria bacterium]